MTTTITPSKLKLIDPANGSYVDTWDEPINANFSTIAAGFGGKTTININNATTGSSPTVTLVFEDFISNPEPWTAQYAGQNAEIYLTGTLTYDVTIYIPTGISGSWIFFPALTSVGGGKLYVANAKNPTQKIEIYNNYMTTVFSDGEFVYYADLGTAKYAIDKYVVSVLPGTIIAWGGVASSYTYLNTMGYFACGGALINTADYPALFAAIGYTWGGSGSQFRLPNLNSDGRFLRGANPTGVSGETGTYQDGMLLSHTHDATSVDAGHKHGILSTGPNANGGGNGWLINPQVDIGVFTLTGQAQVTTTIANTGGVENRPVSATVVWAIKF